MGGEQGGEAKRPGIETLLGAAMWFLGIEGRGFWSRTGKQMAGGLFLKDGGIRVWRGGVSRVRACGEGEGGGAPGRRSALERPF